MNPVGGDPFHLRGVSPSAPNAPQWERALVARYYFHLHDGRERLDEEGVELADAEQARAAAITAAGENLRDIGRSFAGSRWRMWVTDEGGATVCEVRVSVDAPRAA